jgi:hypothetical protein
VDVREMDKVKIACKALSSHDLKLYNAATPFADL